jgi:hypothetical protein
MKLLGRRQQHGIGGRAKAFLTSLFAFLAEIHKWSSLSREGSQIARWQKPLLLKVGSLA